MKIELSENGLVCVNSSRKDIKICSFSFIFTHRLLRIEYHE